jgi:hypothetical protein
MNTTDKHTHLVTGLFSDGDSATHAYQYATDLGYRGDAIDVVMRDDTRQRYFSPAQAGNLAGLSALGTAVATMGRSQVLLGLGIVVAGPLATATAAGTPNSLLDTLVGAGIAEERAQPYEEGVHRGAILLGVAAHSEADALALETEWLRHGGEAVQADGAAAPAATAAVSALRRPAQAMAGGGAIGALAAGGVLQGPAASLDAADERVYWQDHYRNASYYDPAYDFDDYEPAFAFGGAARRRDSGDWDSVEARLAGEWEQVKGKSRMAWEHAKSAVRAAWDRASP